MNKKLRIFSVMALGLFALASCGESGPARVEDTRDLSEFDYTLANVACYDGLNRYVPAGGVENDNTVGMFYFLWHGTHETGIYNISELEKTDPEAIFDLSPNNSVSPVGEFHYWGEPLYGYYRSDDPWVIARHCELLTMAGVDYLIFDNTNAYTYLNVVDVLAEVFTKFQEQGWDVPRIAFYCNSESAATMRQLYNNVYLSNKYSNLWYMVDGKPFIVCADAAIPDSEWFVYRDYFTMKSSQWPSQRPDYDDGFPWMDWTYPQGNYDGTMSVSLAQHPTSNMANPNSWGRGYSFKTATNSADRVNEGSNFEEQWETVHNSQSEEDPDDRINNAFVTGWNEWMAIKQNIDNKVVYCDAFNEEYSRDIEMMKGGYQDNYYLQLVRNVKKFKYSDAEHYLYPEATIDVTDFSEDNWKDLSSVYRDFVGEVMPRNHANIINSETYLNDSDRNDVAKTTVTHDQNYLYFRIETAEDLTTPASGDQGWMNILLDSGSETNNKFANNYDFRINARRTDSTCSIERATGTTTFEEVGEVQMAYQGNILQIAVPLNIIGKTADDVHIRFKVTDNIQDPTNIEDYYVSGEAAPIGRLAYEYGY